MTCDDLEPLVDSYADGELDLARTLEIEQHATGCAACSHTLASRRALRTALRGATPALYYPAPDHLHRTLVRSLRRERRAVAPPRAGIAFGMRRWTGPAALASVAFAALLLVLVVPRLPLGEDPLAHEVVSSHVRSLMAGHLTDVLTSDKHTVKPWFNGRLDFSPTVVDLVKDGYPLVGGRLDDLAERPVAALVYRRGRHLINLFLWPASEQAADTPPESGGTYRGYHVLHWSQSGMTCWAVSDVNEADLTDFARLFRESR